MSQSTAEPPVSPDELQALMTRWLDCFVSAAREQNSQAFQDLFHKHAILFGIHKGGCIDWPLAIQFAFDQKHARVNPCYPHCLCVVDWSMQPVVHGGEVKRGHATFFNVLYRQGHENGLRFVCMHAHFSSL